MTGISNVNSIFKAFPVPSGCASHIGNSRVYLRLRQWLIPQIKFSNFCYASQDPSHILQNAQDLCQTIHRVGPPFSSFFSGISLESLAFIGSFSWFLWLEIWGYLRVLASQTTTQFHMARVIIQVLTTVSYLPLPSFHVVGFCILPNFFVVNSGEEKLQLDYFILAGTLPFVLSIFYFSKFHPSLKAPLKYHFRARSHPSSPSWKNILLPLNQGRFRFSNIENPAESQIFSLTIFVHTSGFNEIKPN